MIQIKVKAFGTLSKCLKEDIYITQKDSVPLSDIIDHFNFPIREIGFITLNGKKVSRDEILNESGELFFVNLFGGG